MVTPTAHLSASELAEVRALCDLSYRAYNDDAWDHALGGLHARVRVDGVLVAHAAIVLRRLLLEDRWLRCGWVESVAVHPEHRRRGLGHAVMGAIEELTPGYDLLGLTSSEDGLALYESRVWSRWRGPAFALTPEGMRPAPGIETIHVWADRQLDLDAPIACDWREGHVW